MAPENVANQVKASRYFPKRLSCRSPFSTMVTKPMLTVLMATFNGSRTLPTVLEAYCQLQAPRGGWKLVVIDNGSKDSSRKIIESFANKLPLTYMYEAKSGKNAALNTGLGEMEGDLVVFTDDDAVPRSDWLVQYRTACDAQPNYSIFGGVVLPRWEIKPEQWILELVPLSGAYALTDPAWQEGPTTPRRVFGPNSAYRSQLFESGYRFNTAIGPAGSNYAMGSEHDFNVRLIKAGFEAWHCRAAVVEHIIRKEQISRKWLLGRAFRSGRGYYRVELKDEVTSPRLIFGTPGFILRAAVEQALRFARAILTGNRRKIFEEKWQLNFLLGQVHEARIIYADPQPKEHQNIATRKRNERPYIHHAEPEATGSAMEDVAPSDRVAKR